MSNGITIMRSLLKRLFDRIGNPLEWSFVDKALLLLVIDTVGFFPQWLFLDLLVRLTSTSTTLWNLSPFWWLFKIELASSLLKVIIIAIGLHTRHRNPDSRWLANVYAILLTFRGLLFFGGFGYSTNPLTFQFVLALTFLMFFFFDLKVTLLTMASWAFVLGFLIVGDQLRLFPYAFLLNRLPFVDGKIDSQWVFVTSGAGIVCTLFILVFVGYVLTRWRDREQKVIELSELLKKMFGRYLSSEVMNSIIENPSALEIGGERRKVTIMITDLRGFTPLSERLDPEQVMRMLNRYLDAMMKICKKYHGTINDITGDELLVTFGAPQEMKDHAQEAVTCAIEMQNAIHVVNEENVREALPELEMGIGLNTSEVVVGNIGSEERAKYGVVGSGVNMTSRIESYTVGGQILISESVRQEAGKVLRIDAQRDVLPKGSETPLRIYEVGGIAGRFNIALEEKEPTLTTLVWQIPFRYTVLEGKDVGKKGLEGSVVRLSKNCAEITLDIPVEMMTNLKMNLVDVDEKLSARDFYGKVIKHSGENRLIHLVHFTSVPPEVDSYFHAFRQHAAKSAVI